MNATMPRYGIYALLIVGAGAFGAAVVSRQRAHNRSESTPPPACSCCEGKEEKTTQLESMFSVPAFELTERSGKPIAASDLKGKVWIADFIYTTCTGPCPMMTARMASLAHDLPARDDLRFVSFSVDPQHDTPEALRKYADQFKADAKRWLFITGSIEKIHELSTKGFRLAMSEPDKSGNVGDIDHSTRFVLVDQQGTIRGYYNGFEAESLAKLKTDATRLLDHKPPASAPASSDSHS